MTADSLLGVEGCCRVVDRDIEAMGQAKESQKWLGPEGYMKVRN